MSDAAAPAAPAPPAKAKKAKKVKKASSHPPYLEMIKEAIVKSGERKGISRQAIVKHIGINYSLSTEDTVIQKQIKMAIKRGVANNILRQLKGTGASGSFKIVAGKKEESKKKKSVAKPKVKKAKPAAKKASIKKPAKKAAKKTPKKTVTKAKAPKKVKKPPKKSAPKKKPVKKTSAKKK